VISVHTTFLRVRRDSASYSATKLLLAALLLAATAAAQAPGGGAPGGASAGAATPASTTSQGDSTSNVTTTTSGNKAVSRNDRTDREAEQTERAEVPAGSQDRLTEFQQMVEATSGRRLPIFGASIFSGVPSTFAPLQDVPVGPGYILGPGDEVHISITGQVNQDYDVTVDRTGALSLPALGTIHVAGLAYSQLVPFLNAQLGKYFRNFTVNANLGALRSIQVFVVGAARRPGSFSISSMRTLTNAIFASGGPLPQGSLRDIQVKRNSITIDHFDLYDLLLNGDKSKDIRLETGDVIFIPPVGPQVAAVGSVNNPAIYELKGDTTINGLLDMAGGETTVAGGSTVRLERIYEHSMLNVVDVPATQRNTEILRAGDIVSVTSIIDRFRDAVTLRGNVANPGRYVWHEGMRISDLIPNKEALITRNYWRKRNQLGQLQQDYQAEQSGDQAQGALQLKSNTTDRSADPTQRAATNSDSGGSSVGAALTGNNSIFEAKTDVILSAPDIDWSYAVVERQNPKDLTTSLIPFNLGKIVLEGDASQNLELFPGDVITIFSKSDLRVPSSQQTRFVRLEGEFVAAGVYSVLPGETLRGLLRRAGGLTPDAYLYASEFTRESTRRVEQQRLAEYADELEAQVSSVTAGNQARAISQADQFAASASAADAQTAIARLRRMQPIGRIVLDLRPDSAGIDSIPDIALEDGDRFVVPRVPSNVNVEGQVYSANAFVYTPGQRAINYMQRAGGPDRQADKKRTFILRADGSVVSRQYADVNRAPIYPGDTVVVPPIIDKRSVLQRVTNIATIIGNFGFAIAATYLITR
jgi:protein involved in polysaccharide export with SLBB domain